MLHVNKLHFAYGSRQVLDGVSFKVGKGELCGLFGPNGSGKTTLFKCCLKFLSFAKGQVYIDQHNIERLRIHEMAGLAAYVPQEHKPPFPYLVKEIVLMGRTPHMRGFFGISHKEREKTLQALELLGITDLANAAYNRLSSGQRQMVLIARAVAQEPRLMFLDEPTSALDFKNQVKIWQVMRKIAQKGITVVACSHDPNHVAWFCDKMVVLKAGKTLAAGHPEDILHQDLLEGIYRNTCQVRQSGAVKLVLPREVAEQTNL